MRRTFLVAAWSAASLAASAVWAVDESTPASADSPPGILPATSASKIGAIEETRTIAVGIEDILDFDFPPTVTVGSAQLMNVQPGANSNQARVYPLKKGTTSITVLDPKGIVRKKIIYNIITNDLSKRVEAIRDLLFDVEGITIKSLDDKVVIDGELVVPRDLDRIFTIQQAYPEVLNLVTLSRISREAIARRMQKEINDQPEGANVVVRVMNDTFFLLGKVDSSADRERAQIIAETYLPEVMGSNVTKEKILVEGVKKVAIRNMIVTEEPPPPPPEKMVRVTYHFVEMGKNFLKLAFFKWAPLASDGGKLDFGTSTTGGVASNGSFVGSISNLLPKLQSGANGGFARILFSTVGITTSGKLLSLNRTDNVPFISSSANGSPIQDNQAVTVGVDVTPTIQGEEKVNLDTKFVFEALTGAGAGGKPGKVTTNLTNSIILKSGDSAVLGGLISNDSSKDIDKDPLDSGGGTGATSAIFNLLRSKAFRTKKTQFVVFLTPKIIADAAEGTADIKAKIINSNKKRQRSVN